MSDPNYANVSLLLAGDGTDGSTTFIDNSPTPKTFTANGNAQISTAQSKFGGASMYFGGVGDWVDTPDTADLAFGSGDWTVECWIKSPGNGGFDQLLGQRDSAGSANTDSPVGLVRNASTGALIATVFSTNLGANVSITSASTAVYNDTWRHIALVRSGTSLKLFIDGNTEASGSITGSVPDSTKKFSVGRAGEFAGQYFKGHVDDLRITKGVAHYTANFTPNTEAFATATFTNFAALTAPAPTLVAGDLPRTINASLTAPPPALSAFGGASVTLTAPAPALSASGGSTADLTAPSPRLRATARSSAGDNSFIYTAPSATLSAFGGATAKLKPPSPTLSIAATVVNFGGAELTAPAATLDATGTVSGTASANLTFGFSNGGSYSLVGYGGAVCSITLTDSPTLQATGTTGSVGRASLTAPLFELTASGTAQNYGSALLTAPAGRLGATAQAWLMAPRATLTAIGTAVVTATYEAYAVNLNHTPKRGVEPVDEATRYTNFPFTHVVRYKGSYFGANSTGLYLLEGTTDDGADISYAVKTATSDLDSPNQKTVASAYFSGRLGPDAAVTLYAGEGAGVPYTYTTPRGALAQNHRQVFGKGIKQHRFYSLGISGSDVLELNSVELDVRNTSRRI